jgi:hypothetical protein
MKHLTQIFPFPAAEPQGKSLNILVEQVFGFPVSDRKNDSLLF